MSDTNYAARGAHSSKRRQRGVAAVEFSLIAVLFFTLVFGVIELARMMFLFNTLSEVTRRAASAAANADFTNPATINQVQWQAIFRASAGGMTLMNELTDQSVRIDYLSVARNADGTFSMVPIAVGGLPSSPAENRKVCLVDPNSSSCIRIVRARVCNPSNSVSCEPMQFQSLLPLVELSLPLPTSPTLVIAKSLGL
jgi:Flp pilus assembly protein TadG